MLCPACKAENPDQAGFCVRCGNPFPTRTALASPTGSSLELGSLPVNLPIPSLAGPVDVVLQGIRLLFSNLGLVVRVVLVVWIPVEILKNFAFHATRIGGDASLVFRIESGLQTLVGSLVTPALIYGLMESLRTGSPPPLRDCFAWGKRHWASTLGANVISGFAIGLGLLLCIVPGVIVWTWYAFVQQAVAVESISPTEALRRSKQLSEGHRLHIFAAGCLVFLICALLFVIGIAPSIFTEAWPIKALTDGFMDLWLQFPTTVFLLYYLKLVKLRAPQPSAGHSTLGLQ